MTAKTQQQEQQLTHTTACSSASNNFRNKGQQRKERHAAATITPTVLQVEIRRILGAARPALSIRLLVCTTPRANCRRAVGRTAGTLAAALRPCATTLCWQTPMQSKTGLASTTTKVESHRRVTQERGEHSQYSASSPPVDVPASWSNQSPRLMWKESTPEMMVGLHNTNTSRCQRFEPIKR